MTTIADLEQIRRRRNGDEYLAALRSRDIDQCRRIVDRHQQETASLAGEAVGPVRPSARRLLARTHGPAEGSEPA